MEIDLPESHFLPYGLALHRHSAVRLGKTDIVRVDLDSTPGVFNLFQNHSTKSVFNAKED
jgi:hypothetical protein